MFGDGASARAAAHSYYGNPELGLEGLFPELPNHPPSTAQALANQIKPEKLQRAITDAYPSDAGEFLTRQVDLASKLLDGPLSVDEWVEGVRHA